MQGVSILHCNNNKKGKLLTAMETVSGVSLYCYGDMKKLCENQEFFW